MAHGGKECRLGAAGMFGALTRLGVIDYFVAQARIGEPYLFGLLLNQLLKLFAMPSELLGDAFALAFQIEPSLRFISEPVHRDRHRLQFIIAAFRHADI